jgi:hypothetical protein
MQTNGTAVCGQWLALGLMFTACDDGQDVGDAELAAAEDTEADEDVELRNSCAYNSVPEPTDVSDSLVGADDEVASEDASDGGCDLHVLRVTAAPPSDRARTVEFDAFSMAPFDEWNARVWTKSCAGLLCPTSFSMSAILLTQTGGGQVCPTINDCFPLPYRLQGHFNLSATNTVTDLRAGMRALDDDGDPIEVSITVSE